ncbi:hypothetical protein FRC07_007432 [Ceratobasidium sp. 392]|nr:hypothetical protein FRC07_007432 [Ceratobasidium sp. 392]
MTSVVASREISLTIPPPVTEVNGHLSETSTPTAVGSTIDGGRTLILCFDGTSNRYNEKNTNVVKFMSLIKIDVPERQLVYYQPGIGTYTNPGIFTPLSMKMANILDQAVAWYIGAHITGGYKWLMNTYRHGDRICIFGFSRGAYTARALAGMINKVGLLPAGNDEQVTIAYDIYRTDTKEGYTLGDGFRDTFSRVVPIEFVGVWDSVSSVGLIRSHTLPYAASNNIISTFRHAMALDERRGWFTVDPWHIPDVDREVRFRLLTGTIGYMHSPNTQGMLSRFLMWLAFGSQKNIGEVERADRVPGVSGDKLFAVGSKARATTDVKEVWFAGGHSDVGGSSVPDTTPHSLSNITLRWMVRECQLTHAGIIWNEPRLRQLAIDLSPERLELSRSITNQAPIIHERGATPSYNTEFGPLLSKFEEGRAEFEDAKSPVHDSLKPKWTWPAFFPLGFNLLWWILEFFPMKLWFQDDHGKWHSRHRVNMGRPRHAVTVTGELPMFHISVLAKEQHPVEGTKPYQSRAELDKGVVPLYVD